MAITIKRDMGTLMKHDISIRNHLIPTDVLSDAGGEDLGPDPHDLYDAALGACKALTLLWYANRKAIPVEDISVTVERNNSREAKGKESIYSLKAEISLTGNITEAQRQDLQRVASKCPIHRLMSDVKTEIETVLR